MCNVAPRVDCLPGADMSEPGLTVVTCQLFVQPLQSRLVSGPVEFYGRLRALSRSRRASHAPAISAASRILIKEHCNIRRDV